MWDTLGTIVKQPQFWGPAGVFVTTAFVFWRVLPVYRNRMNRLEERIWQFSMLFILIVSGIGTCGSYAYSYFNKKNTTTDTWPGGNITNVPSYVQFLNSPGTPHSQTFAFMPKTTDIFGTQTDIWRAEPTKYIEIYKGTWVLTFTGLRNLAAARIETGATVKYTGRSSLRVQTFHCDITMSRERFNSFARADLSIRYIRQDNADTSLLPSIDTPLPSLKIVDDKSLVPCIQDYEGSPYSEVRPAAEKGAWNFFPVAEAAHLKASEQETEKRLESPDVQHRMKGMEDLIDSFGSVDGTGNITFKPSPYESWIRSMLEKSSTPFYTQAAIIIALKKVFTPLTLVYPRPHQLDFLSTYAYQNIVWNGLDNSTQLSHDSRRFLFNARDERIATAFDSIRDDIYSNASRTEKSCFALYEFSVLYNWAAFTAEDILKAAKQGASNRIDLGDIHEVQSLTENAKEMGKYLAGDDKVQLDVANWLLGSFYASITSEYRLKRITLGKGVDPTHLQNVARSYLKTLVSMPAKKIAVYNFPFEISLAKRYLESKNAERQLAAFQPAPKEGDGVERIAKPWRGCAQPTSD